MITIDFETRSACDLRAAGAYLYSIHPTTRVLCLAWSYGDEDEVHLWHPAVGNLPEEGAGELTELRKRVALGEEVEAHNAFFERCIWNNVAARLMGWPEMDPGQIHCSAAKAASFALPRDLEGACAALGLPHQKDAQGHRLMLKLSKPRKPRVAELRRAGFGRDQHDEFTLEHGYLWHEKPDDLRRLFDYCRQDVRAERGLSAALRPMPPDERRAWLLDQEVNWRGVHCDRAMVERACDLVDADKEDAAQELRVLTLGEVESGTKRPAFKAWLDSEGAGLPDTQGTTIDQWLLRGDLEDHVRRALELWKRCNRTSTAKYRATRDRMCPDDRVRDILRFHGASTGRWAGSGIQPQNYPRGGIKDMDAAGDAIRDMDADQLLALYQDLMEHLSHVLRGTICAPPGWDLICADFGAIEARGTFWVAGDAEALEEFRKVDAGYYGDDQDIYTREATALHGRTIRKGDPERQDGKVVILGCGYQMGHEKLVTYAAQMGTELSLERSKELVGAYRAKHKPVKDFWYAVERAAIRAVERGPRAKDPVECGPTRWAQRGRFLHCRLPSGRLLSYCNPEVRMGETPWGDPCKKLHFMGVDTYTHKWSPQTTYGGKLTENVVQGLSRDVMRDGMLRIQERAGETYHQVLTVHDEVLSEVREGEGDLGEYCALLAEVPAWAPGLPLVAEGWRGRRYRK